MQHAQVLTGEHDRCSAKAVLRVNARHVRTFVDTDDQQVLAMGLADIRLRDTERNTGDGKQLLGVRNSEIDGHDDGKRIR